MPDAWKLRQQAERCRTAANMGKKAGSNPYLRDLAEHYERAADEAEALERAGDKPKVTDRY
jgi:hypothetical protein